MLATGGSLTAAIQFLREAGVKDIRCPPSGRGPEALRLSSILTLRYVCIPGWIANLMKAPIFFRSWRCGDGIYGTAEACVSNELNREDIVDFLNEV